MPRETLARLTSLPVAVEFIHGNGEIAVLQQLAGQEPIKVPEIYRPAIRWTADQIRGGDAEMIAGWPLTLAAEMTGVGRVLFCHATPRNADEIFTSDTPEERLLPVFADLGVSLVVCGHTHMPFDRMVGRTRVVNAGSVGMPFGPAGADWLLLGPDVELRHTSYDLQAAAALLRTAAFPSPEDFAARYVLDPPAAAEMRAAFNAVSI
jgi:diadenosine tetraphosphatase ApaH/serine/threonine PP2A family protein phosphatase